MQKLQADICKIMQGNADGCIKNTLEMPDQKHQVLHYNQGGLKRKEGTVEQLYALQNIFNITRISCAFLHLKSLRLRLETSTVQKTRETTQNAKRHITVDETHA